MRKHLLSLIIVLTLLIPASAWAAVNVNLDGQPVTYTANSGFPFVDNANRTQVPFRQTMEAFGCKVDWDQTSQTAIAEKNGITVKVPIGQSHIYKNGVLIKNDTAALIKDARTYLPIRVVLEAFGANVGWDNSTQTVIVTTGQSNNIITPPQNPNPPTPPAQNNTSVKQSEAAYTGNSNSFKFHINSCSAAKRISDKNLIYFKTRADAIAAGYVPCKICNP